MRSVIHKTDKNEHEDANMHKYDYVHLTGLYQKRIIIILFFLTNAMSTLKLV